MYRISITAIVESTTNMLKPESILMQRQLYHLQRRFPFKQDTNIIQGVTLSDTQILIIL